MTPTAAARASHPSTPSLRDRLKDASLLRDHCYIDGVWVGTPSRPVTNPVNGVELAKVPVMSTAEAKRDPISLFERDLRANAFAFVARETRSPLCANADRVRIVPSCGATGVRGCSISPAKKIGPRECMCMSWRGRNACFSGLVRRRLAEIHGFDTGIARHLLGRPLNQQRSGDED